MNVYQMLQEVRSNIGEPTEADNGRWTDLDLLRKLNAGYQTAWSIVANSPGDRLITSTELSPSAGSADLPFDFRRLVHMEEKDSKTPIYVQGTVRERGLQANYGKYPGWGDTGAYLLGETVRFYDLTYAKTITLWYEKKFKRLLTGTGTTGSTTNAIVVPLSVQPSKVNDYYNGLYLEVFDGTGEGTRAQITDYAASTRTLTVAGSFGTDSVFGLESELPEEADIYIVLYATVLAMATPGAAFDPKYFDYFRDQMLNAKNNFTEAMAERVADSGFVRVYEVD